MQLRISLTRFWRYELSKIARWLQSRIGQGYTAKDRSGKLEAFEEPNLTALIAKLGFSMNVENKESK
jgi:hypothetical protein